MTSVLSWRSQGIDRMIEACAGKPEVTGPDTHTKELRIGDVLIRSGLVTQAALTDALETSIHRDEPVGKILVSEGKLSNVLLQAAIEIQSRVRDSAIEAEVGIQALSMMSTASMSIEEALQKITHVHATDYQSNKLGELLCLSGIASREQLDRAIIMSHQTSLPLGRVLMALGVVWEELLAVGLDFQSRVRAGELSKQAAAEKLHSEFNKRIPPKPAVQAPIQQPATAASDSQNPGVWKLLGELIVDAGICNAEALERCIQSSIAQNKLLGQTMIEAGCLTDSQLDAALRLQQMVANLTLGERQAVETLSKMRTTDGETDMLAAILFDATAAHVEQRASVRFRDFLNLCGFDVPPRIILACDTVDDPIDESHHLAQALSQLEYIEKRWLFAVVRAYRLFATGRLQLAQAVTAVQSFEVGTDQLLDETLLRLGITRVVETPKKKAAPSSN